MWSSLIRAAAPPPAAAAAVPVPPPTPSQPTTAQQQQDQQPQERQDDTENDNDVIWLQEEDDDDDENVPNDNTNHNDPKNDAITEDDDDNDEIRDTHGNIPQDTPPPPPLLEDSSGPVEEEEQQQQPTLGGFFVGRWTRFLEQVTTPDPPSHDEYYREDDDNDNNYNHEEQDIEGNGWDEDDDDDMLDVEVDDYHDNYPKNQEDWNLGGMEETDLMTAESQFPGHRDDQRLDEQITETLPPQLLQVEKNITETQWEDEVLLDDRDMGQQEGRGDDTIDITDSPNDETEESDRVVPSAQPPSSEPMSGPTASTMIVTDATTNTAVTTDGTAHAEKILPQRTVEGWGEDDDDILDISVSTDDDPPAHSTAGTVPTITTAAAATTTTTITTTVQSPGRFALPPPQSQRNVTVSQTIPTGSPHVILDDDDHCQPGDNDEQNNSKHEDHGREQHEDDLFPLVTDDTNHFEERRENREGLAQEVAQAQQNLQAVLDEIDVQEGHDRRRRVNESMDSVLEEDEMHAQQAVFDIQKEMDSILNRRRRREHIVDHVPRTGRLPSDDSPSLAVLFNADDHSRDTGPIDNVSGFNDAGMSLAEEQEVFDDEDEMAFGPVVDHLPKRSPTNREGSLAPQGVKWDDNNAWDEDDDELVSYENYRQNDDLLTADTLLDTAVVDHTPRHSWHPPSRDLSIGALASVGDTLTAVEEDEVDEADEKHKFGPVVDVIPSATKSVASLTSMATAPISGSMAVHAEALSLDFQEDEAMDETLNGDSTIDGGATLDAVDGWDNDDGFSDFDINRRSSSQNSIPKNAPKKIISFSSNITVDTHVVDHTPSELITDDNGTNAADIDPSVKVLAADEDLTRDTGPDDEVYDDENEQEYGPVVDHLPQTPRFFRGESGANSLIVNASTVGNDSEYDEKMEESCYGDSTSDGGMPNAIWDQSAGEGAEVALAKSIRANENSLMAVVDHTPSEIGTGRRLIVDPSVDVVASDGLTKDDGDADSTHDIVYGPVVDQTPETPALRGKELRSDSIIVQFEEVDEDSTVGDDDDGIGVHPSESNEQASHDAELSQLPQVPSPVRLPEDQVVDHVPSRPEPRFGDASTGVAADPSEVLSEVDDMTHEGGNFGPVVDVTPFAQSVGVVVPSGAGSTVVFAPSVPADDLDDADETDNNDDHDSWAPDDLGTDQEPNPQSGNDEPRPPPFNEQLVDFLPPPTYPDMSREALSEMTLGGLSLLHGEDPVEDDFGPVVDHTPTLPSSAQSHASTISLVSPSECRAMDRDDVAAGISDDLTQVTKSEIVVDQLPQLRDRIPADSVATVFRSQLSEEEVEDDDYSKFGPVVDQLPTPQLSHSVPSRGGSTVDALANVSEANSDAGGDGWDDDDVELDASEGCTSDGAALSHVSGRGGFRSSHHTSDSTHEPERSMSVRFDSSVFQTESSVRSSQLDTDEDEKIKIDNTCYFDPDTGTSSVWGDALLLSQSVNEEGVMGNKSFAEADTPPSTPYRRQELQPFDARSSDKEVMDPILPILVSRDDQQLHCQACQTSSSSDCPCIQKILESNDSDSALVASVIGPQGEQVNIDFGRLLRGEITKRRLVEEECKSLRVIAESLNEVEMRYSTKDERQAIEITDLKNEKTILAQRVAQLEERSDFLSREIETSKSLHATEVDEIRNANDKQLQKILSLESECVSLQEQNRALRSEIESSNAKMAARATELQQENIDLRTRLGNLDEEKVRLENNLNHASSSAATVYESERRYKELSNELSERLVSLEHEKAKVKIDLDDALVNLALKERDFEASGEVIAQLKSTISDLEEKLVMSEDMHGSTQHEKDHIIADMSQRVKLMEKELNAAHEHLSQRSLIESEKEKKLLAISSDVDILRSEKQSLQDTLAHQQRQHQNEMLEQSMLLKHLQSNVFELERTLESLRMEKEAVDRQIEKYHSAEDELGAMRSTIQLMTEERQSLQSSYRDEKRSLEERIEQLESFESELRLMSQTEHDELRRLLEEANHELMLKSNDLNEVTIERDSLTEANSKLSKAMIDLETSMKAMKISLDAANLASLREAAKAKSLSEELSQVNKELAMLRANTESERRNSVVAAAEKDKLLNALSSDCQKHECRVKELEKILAETQTLARTVKTERDSLVEERDSIRSRWTAFEKEYESLRHLHDHRNEEVKQLHQHVIPSLESEVEQLRHELAAVDDLRNQLDCENIRVNELLDARDKLEAENEDMLVQFGFLKREMDASEEQVRTLREELARLSETTAGVPPNDYQDLQRHVEYLTSKVETLAAEKSALGTQYASSLEEKEALICQIEKLESRVGREVSLQSNNESLSAQTDSLQKRINLLTTQLSASESENTALKYQLRSSDEERHILIQQIGSHEEVKAKEVLLIKEKECLLGQLRELENKSHYLETKCHRLEEELAKLQEVSSNLSNENHQFQTLHERMRKLEAESIAKDRVIASKESDLQSLNSLLSQISDTSELQRLQHEIRQKELTISQNCDKVENLAKTCESLRAELETAQVAANAVPELRQQVESLGGILQITQRKLACKENEVNELQVELKKLEAMQNDITNSMGMMSEQASDVKTLRAHVINLAVALERSETRRAEIIERLQTERHQSADSLRRLSESMKRYYSTVSLPEV